MAKLEQVTYTPDSEGGRLHTTLHAGEQEMTSTWPIGERDGTVRSLLDQLTVRVHEVTYISSATGAEIHVMLEIGGHRYVAAFPLDEGSADLKPPIDHLMDEVGKAWIDSLQTLLGNRTASGMG